MEDSFTIDQLDQLKALADPLRHRILTAFCCQPVTTMQVAAELGEKPTRLYHHVDLLEKAGLIRLVKTRQKRGTVEKYYQASARRFLVDQRLTKTSSDEEGTEIQAQTMLANLLQTALVDVQDHFDSDRVAQEDGAPSIAAGQATIRLSRGQARLFIERISAIFEQCCQMEEEGEADPYSVTVALFPTRLGARP